MSVNISSKVFHFYMDYSVWNEDVACSVDPAWSVDPAFDVEADSVPHGVAFHLVHEVVSVLVYMALKVEGLE